MSQINDNQRLALIHLLRNSSKEKLIGVLLGSLEGAFHGNVESMFHVLESRGMVSEGDLEFEVVKNGVQARTKYYEPRRLEICEARSLTQTWEVDGCTIQSGQSMKRFLISA